MTPTSISIHEVGMHHEAGRGGADRYFFDLCHTLRKLGHPVSSAAFGNPDPKYSGQISLGGEKDMLPKRMNRLWRFAGHVSKSSDAVLASHFSLYALPLILRRPRMPHVVHFHGPWSDEAAAAGGGPGGVWAKRLIERYVYRSADQLITLSAAFSLILEHQYGVRRDRVHVIPGGVDLDRFHPGEGRMTARQKLGWAGDRRVIVCVRRLVPRMGVDKLIEAFTQIASDFPEWDLCLGGTGPIENQLREYAHHSGLNERIRFLGFISEENLPCTYQAADFTVVPSQSLEGFGLVAAESLACGTPVVVTPVGGLPEAVAGLDDELLIAPEASVNGLVSALRRAMLGPLPDTSVCRTYAEKHYCWRKITQRILDVYQLAISSQKQYGKK